MEADVLLQLRDAPFHLGAVGRVGHLLQVALVVLERDGVLASFSLARPML